MSSYWVIVHHFWFCGEKNSPSFSIYCSVLSKICLRSFLLGCFYFRFILPLQTYLHNKISLWTCFISLTMTVQEYHKVCPSSLSYTGNVPSDISSLNISIGIVSVFALITFILVGFNRLGMVWNRHSSTETLQNQIDKSENE